VYLYKVVEEGIPVGRFLDDMTMQRFCGELRKQTNRQNVWNMGCRIDDFDGVIAVYDMKHMYMSQWTDVLVDVRQFVTWQDWVKKNAEPSVQDEQPADNQEQQVSEPKSSAQDGQVSEPESSAQDGQVSEPESSAQGEQVSELKPSAQDEQSEQGTQLEQTLEAAESLKKKEQRPSAISDLTIRLMENRPKLPDLENHEIYDCVRIEPNDIGLLEMDNWRLGVNSFLTHGFYNYKYLMLGKLRFQDGVVKAVLGVPGVYDNKEQYIAKIFGFEVFVPVKHSNMKTGRFGYWIVELV
jgi:hypothetical protein